MINYTYCVLFYKDNEIDFTKTLKTRKRRIFKNNISCDSCGGEWNEWNDRTIAKAHKRKEQLCPQCLGKLMKEQLVAAGTKALNLISAEQRKVNAILAGKASQKTGKPSKTWFSTARWNEMTDDEKQNQVTRANKSLHKKLRTGSKEEREAHYAKVFRNSAIGYISKGHQHLHEEIKQYGFQQEVQIDSCKVDECNENLKIIIEYNGDAFHCNPKFWEGEQYNSLIKMKAKEKWKLDNKRYGFLKSLGYYVMVIWENDWINDKENVLLRIEELTQLRAPHITRHNHEKI